MGLVLAMAAGASQPAVAAGVGQPVPLTPRPATALASMEDGPVATFGTGIPLSDAVEEIVPPNTPIEIMPGVDRTVALTWKRGPSWRTALDQALAAHGLVAVYTAKGVRIIPEGGSSGPVTMAAASSSVQSPVEALSATPDVPPQEVWQVYTNEHVETAVRRWAKQAGMTALPRFKTREDWQILVSQEFVGSFDKAIAWLSEGFSDQAKKPVVVPYPNKVIDLIDVPTGASEFDPLQGRVR